MIPNLHTMFCANGVKYKRAVHVGSYVHGNATTTMQARLLLRGPTVDCRKTLIRDLIIKIMA